MWKLAGVDVAVLWMFPCAFDPRRDGSAPAFTWHRGRVSLTQFKRGLSQGFDVPGASTHDRTPFRPKGFALSRVRDWSASQLVVMQSSDMGWSQWASCDLMLLKGFSVWSSMKLLRWLILLVYYLQTLLIYFHRGQSSVCPRSYRTASFTAKVCTLTASSTPACTPSSMRWRLSRSLKPANTWERLVSPVTLLH